MKHSTPFTKLAASLVAAQKEMKAVGKDAVNPHFKNRYASLDGIIETVRPILAKHGLTVIQGAENPVTDPDGSLCGFAVETMLVHESGEWLSSAVLMPLTKADAQGAGGALTYGRRYGLSALLSLATDDDDDGNVASTPRAASPQRANSPASTNGAQPATSRGASGSAATMKPMPFGKMKGKLLGDLPSDELERTLTWCREKDAEKFKDLIASLSSVLTDRALAVGSNVDSDGFPVALRDDNSDGLPF